MQKIASIFVLTLALPLALTGCGDSDGDANATDDAGMDGSRPMRVDRDSGSMTVDVEVEYMCEDTKCTVPDVDVGFLLDAGVDLGGIDLSDLNLPPSLLAELTGIRPEGCCIEGDMCGVTEKSAINIGMCLLVDQPGEPNENCPDETIDVDGIDVPLAGCCRPDNRCGVVLDAFGVGCVDRVFGWQIKGQVEGFDAGTGEDQEMPCVHSGSGGNDGGMNDGG